MYLIAAGNILPSDIHEIEGRMAQHGLNVDVVRAGSYDHTVITPFEKWDGDKYVFTLACSKGGQVDPALLAIIHERLTVSDYAVERDGCTFTLEFIGNKEVAACVVINRVRWIITTTLNFLCTAP